MSILLDSYVSRVLFATPTPARGLDADARRWRWLRSSLFDPYRPELHYMRGPVRNGERSTRAAPFARTYSGFIVADLIARERYERAPGEYWTL